jgi:hypothetical protein
LARLLERYRIARASDTSRRVVPAIASAGIAGARDRLVTNGIAGFERRPRRKRSSGSLVR